MKIVNIEEMEKRLDRWLIQRRYRLITFALIILVLFGSSVLPYLNLYIDSYFIVFIALVIAPFVLNINSRIFIVVGILLIPFACFLWFLNQTEEVEALTDLVYALLVAGILKKLFSR